MNNRFKRTVPFIFFFGYLVTISAQKDYHEGYVVTNANDTLFGLVKDRKTGPFGEIYDKIRFKGKRKKKRFSPKEIQAYKIGDTSFRSMFLDGEKSFLKVITEGYVNYYVYEIQEQGEQLVQEVEYLQKENSTLLVRATLGIFGLQRKRLAEYFYDCPPLVQKIRNKEFKYVYEIVDFYNNWKNNKSDP